jgi:dihydroneopterin aldolase
LEKAMATLIIQDLALRIHIGVTERERKKKQKILISIETEPEMVSGQVRDSIGNTVDYSSMRSGIRTLLMDSRHNLIETVADKVAGYVLDNFMVKQVSVTVKKFPYRDTKFVGYRLNRKRSN